MKKIILTVVAIFAFGFANAQENNESSEGFSKGDVFVTGAFSYGSTNDKNNDEKTSSFEIAPQVNYFVTENISLGARIGFASDMTEVNGTEVQDDSSVAFGLLGRYYFTPASKFSLFGQVAAEYATLTQNVVGDPEFKVNGFGASVGLGLNYFVSSNFSIEASFAALQFASAKADVPNAENVSSFSLGADMSAITFGVNYKF
jgi:outer membrane protein